jgi:hypothetical protein
MRASATLLSAGLSAAVVVLAACGGSDKPSTPAAESSTASSASAGNSTSGEDAVAFCSQAVSLQKSANATVSQASSDPTQLPPALQQLADQYAAVTAPREIAGDWRTIVDGLGQLATAARGIDFTDPAAADQLRVSVGGLQSQLTTASTNVSTYASAHCPPPAPTG